MKQIFTLLAGLAISFGFGQTVLTQSVDPSTVDTGGVACWNSGNGEYRDNAFARTYDMSAFEITGDFNVSAIQFGQGSADEGKVVTLNVYSIDDEDLALASFTLLFSADVTLSAANDMSLIEAAVVGVIPAGSIVAVEVFGPDAGTDINQRYFPGFNLAGENSTPWLKSDGCGIWWTDANTVAPAAGDQPYVINLVGEEVLGVTEVIGTNLLSVYPNPATDVINVSVKSGAVVDSIEVVNLAGQSVFTSKAANSVNISFLPAGVYVVKVKDNKGVTYTSKVVKK